MNQETIYNLLASLNPILNGGMIKNEAFRKATLDYLEEVDLEKENLREDIPVTDLRGIIQATKLILSQAH